MASIETIGIEFDTSGLQRGQRALSDTERAANVMAASVDRAGNATLTASGSVQQLIDRQRIVNTEMAQGASAATAQSVALLRMAGATDAQVAEYRQLIEAQNRVNAGSTQSVGLLGQLKAALLTLGLGAAAVQAIKMADAYTMLNSRLALVTQGTENLRQTQAALFKLAQDAGTGIQTTTDLYIGLARATKDAGTSQSQLLSVTDTFGKALAISGASTASGAAAITQFNQAMASGVLRGEEFNSMNEQAPRIMDVLAQTLGKTKGELRALAAEGKLTSDVVLPALVVGGAKVSEEFDKMPKTISQAMEIATNSLYKFIGGLNEATGATSAIANGIIWLSENGMTMAKVVGVVLVGALSAYAMSLAVAATATGVLATVSGAATVAIGALRVAVAALGGPITIAFGLVASAVAAIIAFGDSAEDTAKKVDKTSQAAVDAAQAQEQLDKALNKLNNTSDTFLSKEEQKADAMKKLNIEYFKAQVGVLDEAKAVQLANAYKEKAAEIDEKYKTKKTESARAVDKEKEAFTNLITTLRTANEAATVEIILGEKATASQKKRFEIDQALASGKLKLSEASRQEAYAELQKLDAAEKVIAAMKVEKEVAKALEQSDLARKAATDTLAMEYKLYGQSSEAREIAMIAIKGETALEKSLSAEKAKGVELTEKQIAAIRKKTAEQIAAEQATAAQSKALGYAETLAKENERFAAESIVNEKDRAAAILEIDAKVWKERITLAGDGTEAQKTLQAQYVVWYANQVAKPLLEEERKVWDSIEKTAHDTFVSILDGGKGTAQRLRDTMKNVFFDWLYSMTLKKWVVNLQGQFSSNGAGAVASLAGGGEGGGIGGLLSAAKTGYTALSNGVSGMIGMFSEGLHQFGATITSNVAALGEWMGGSVGEMLGSNALAIGNAGIWAGGIGAGLGAGKLISNGYSVAGNSGNGAVMLGTALGAIWGPLGSALGGAIGGLVNRAFGMGAKEVTGTTIQGNLGGQGFDGSFQDAWKQKGGWFRSDKSGTTTRAIDEATATGLGDAYAKITTASRDYAKALGVDADYITNRSQSVSIALGKDQAANEKAISDFFTGVANTIAGELVPGIATLSKEGEAASATLERLAVQYTTIDATLRALGVSGESAFGAVGVATLAAREKLLALTGGLDSFVSQASYFAQNYLTEAERLAPVQEQVAAKMAELGLAGVDTAAEFRDAVLGLTKSGALATESGANLYAELMKIAPAFKQVADASAEATRVQEEAAQKARDDAAAAAQRLADANQPYLDRIAKLEESLGATIDWRARETAGMDASTVALYDREKALQKEVDARAAQAAKEAQWTADRKAREEAEAAAAQKAAADKEALDARRADMETTLFNLTHSAEEQLARAREQELAALDATLVPLQQQIYAQQDLAAAATKAAAEIQVAAQKAAAVASERAGIERNILQLQGDTAALRQKELAALDPANRALQESYYALQDKMAAEAQAAQFAQAAAQAQLQAASEAEKAAEALQKTLKSITDSIFDEVSRLMGLDAGGKQTVASAEAAFAVATAQARAGDQEAAKALPGLSKALDALLTETAVTDFDLRLARARQASSLAQTAAGFGVPVAGGATPAAAAAAYNAPLPTVAATGAAQEGMAALLAEIVLLREAVEVLQDPTKKTAEQVERQADMNERLSDGGNAYRVEVVTP